MTSNKMSSTYFAKIGKRGLDISYWYQWHKLKAFGIEIHGGKPTTHSAGRLVDKNT